MGERKRGQNNKKPYEVIVTLVFQLQLYSSLEFHFPQVTVFVSQKACTFTFLYMHMCGGMCVVACVCRYVYVCVHVICYQEDVSVLVSV